MKERKTEQSQKPEDLLFKALTDEEAEMFMQEADLNGDGKLDYDEFVKMMLSY